MEQQIRLSARVPEPPEFDRLDLVASRLFPQYSRNRLQQWIRDGALRVDGAASRPRNRLRGGELLEIDARLEWEEARGAEPLAFGVRYEDPDLLVVDKPPGLVTHPAPGHWGGTLVNGLLYRFPELAVLPRAGLIHRLDQGTSGLLIVARTIDSYHALVKLMQGREIHRTYDAVVQGLVEGPGSVDLPIGRDPRDRKRMAIQPNGKQAITHFRVVRRFQSHTHLVVTLETGRTHQIRVHMTHLRHPLVGDPVYGKQFRARVKLDDATEQLLTAFGRQALHASAIAFRHPITGVSVQVMSPLPEDLATLLEHISRVSRLP